MKIERAKAAVRNNKGTMRDLPGRLTEAQAKSVKAGSVSNIMKTKHET